MEDIDKLVEDWCYAVNQPVVDSVEFLLDKILENISDGGNFTQDQCKQILIHFINIKP